MVILFTLWFILQWQFPTWLWVFSGFFYVISLRPKKKIKKKQVPITNKVLPLYLALAIIFGTDVLGNSILPESISAWAVIGILLGSILIRFIVASPVIKKEFSKGVKSDNKSNFTINGDRIEVNNDEDDDELKLHIKIKNKEKNKSSNFKISLENGFIKEAFVKNIIIKGM